MLGELDEPGKAAGRDREVEGRRAQQVCLERLDELVVAPGDRAQAFLEAARGAGEVRTPEERLAELQRNLRAPRRLLREIERVAQVRPPDVRAGGQLRTSQLHQQVRSVLRLQRLDERARQIGRRDIGRAALERARGGSSQRLHRPVLAARLRREQVQRDLLVVRPEVLEYAGRLEMLPSPVERPQVGVDRGTDEGVDELEGVRAQEVGLRQRVGGFDGLGPVEARKGGHDVRLRAVPEHGDGPGEVERARGQPANPPQHRAGHRRGSQLEHAMRLCCDRFHAFGRERVH